MRALILAARAETASGNAVRGVEHAQRALSLSPDNEWAWRVLALALSDAGRFDDARDAAARATALAPDNWRAHLQAAAVDVKAQTVTFETQAAATRAVQLAPNEPLTHLTLGNVALAKGYLNAAEDAYRRALALDPQLESARNNLAVVSLRQGSLGEAAAGFVDLLSDSPTSVQARGNLLASVARMLARVRLVLGAGVFGTVLVWFTTREQAQVSDGSALAAQLGMLLFVVGVGVAWIVLATRFVSGAGVRSRLIVRAVWRFDRRQSWTALLAAATYAVLVVAALQPTGAGVWGMAAIVLYATLTLIARRGRRT